MEFKTQMIENAINEIKSVRQFAEHKENEAIEPFRKFGVIGVSLFTHDVQFSQYEEVEKFTNEKITVKNYYNEEYSHGGYVEKDGITYFALMTPSEYVEWKERENGSS